MLVTGASGLLGANFVPEALARYRITALQQHAFQAGLGVESLTLDLCDAAAVQAVLARVRPAVIVHLAAATNVDWCEQHPEATREMNVETTAGLARWAAEHDATFLFMSTDSVFAGDAGNYTERDAPAPLNRYAHSKLEAEEAVRSLAGRHLIVRSNLYGWNVRPKQSLAEWVLARLRQGQTVPGFTDVIFNPLLANTLAGLMLELLARGAAGTVHLGADEGALSKFSFARLLAEEFGLDASLVQPARLAQASLMAPRPLNTSLRCDRARSEFGLPLPKVPSDLGRFRQRQPADKGTTSHEHS